MGIVSKGNISKRHSHHFHEICDRVKFYNSCKLFKFQTFNCYMSKKKKQAASLKRNRKKEFMFKEKFGWLINAERLLGENLYKQLLHGDFV